MSNRLLSASQGSLRSLPDNDSSATLSADEGPQQVDPPASQAPPTSSSSSTTMPPQDTTPRVASGSNLPHTTQPPGIHPPEGERVPSRPGSYGAPYTPQGQQSGPPASGMGFTGGESQGGKSGGQHPYPTPSPQPPHPNRPPSSGEREQRPPVSTSAPIDPISQMENRSSPCVRDLIHSAIEWNLQKQERAPSAGAVPVSSKSSLLISTTFPFFLILGNKFNKPYFKPGCIVLNPHVKPSFSFCRSSSP